MLPKILLSTYFSFSKKNNRKCFIFKLSRTLYPQNLLDIWKKINTFNNISSILRNYHSQILFYLNEILKTIVRKIQRIAALLKFYFQHKVDKINIKI